jgi:signal transduction histidine kinase
MTAPASVTPTRPVQRLAREVHDVLAHTLPGLLRVAQEALTNVRRHAAAQRVELALDHSPDGARLTVQDVGAPAAPAGAGYGLTGMRERAELLGGRLTATATDRGFRVELWVPA